MADRETAGGRDKDSNRHQESWHLLERAGTLALGGALREPFPPPSLSKRAQCGLQEPTAMPRDGGAGVCWTKLFCRRMQKPLRQGCPALIQVTSHFPTALQNVPFPVPGTVLGAGDLARTRRATCLCS